MHKLKKVTINGSWEDWLGDSLPANDNCEIHRSKNLLAWAVNESLAGVANSMNEVVNGLACDGGFTSVEFACNRGIEIQSLVPEPRSPVEFLDAVIAAFHDFSNWSISSLGMVSEDEWESNGLAKCCGVLDHVDRNLILPSHANLDDWDVLAGSWLF